MLPEAFNSACGQGRKGDIIGQLAEDYAPMLMKELGRYSGLPTAVKEDIVQDLFLRLATECERHGEVANWGGYLRNSVKNAASSWFKESGRTEPYANPSGDDPNGGGLRDSGTDLISPDATTDLIEKQFRNEFHRCLDVYKRETSRVHLLPAFMAIHLLGEQGSQAWRRSDSKTYEAFRQALAAELPLLRKHFGDLWDRFEKGDL